MISIKLNGKQYKVRSGCSILDLLKTNNIDPDQVAIEHNKIILNQKSFAETIIRNTDEIEIVEFVGGG